MIPLSPITLKEIFYPTRLRSLPSYLNLWSIDENIVIGADLYLQMSYVYEITGVDLLHKNEFEIEQFFNSARNFLHSIPANITIQFVVQKRIGNDELISKYKQNITTTDSPFSQLVIEQKIKHLKEEINPVRKRYLMYVTTYSPDADVLKMSASFFKILTPDYKRIGQGIHRQRVQHLNEVVNVLLPELRSLGIKTRQLTTEELQDLFYEHLNPGRSEYLDFNHNRYNPELTLRSQIVYNACLNDFPHIFIDGYYYRGVNLHTRPYSILYTQLIDFLSQLPGEYDYVLSISTPNQDALIKDLQFSATIATIISTINPLKRNYDAEIKAQDSNELIEYVKTNFQKLFLVSICIVTRSESLESLTRKTNQIVSAFRTLGEAEGSIADMTHLYLFLSALPNHAHLNLRKHIFHTDAIAQFIPWHQEWPGTKEVKSIFITKENEIIPYDLFSAELPAKHALVLGTTGAGKSFFTNYILTNFYLESEKNHIIIVDIGGSYRKICKWFGGEYFEIEPERYGFNPFPPKSVTLKTNEDGTVELDPDIIEYLKCVVKKLLKKDNLSGQEDLILEKAITNTYIYLKQEYDTPILSNLHYQLNFYSKENNDETEQDTYELTQARKIAKEFAANLATWTEGYKGKTVNRQTSIHPEARMIVFDLQKLQEHQDLQTIILFLIQNVIWRKLYNKELKKIIVFDECWKLLDDPIAADLIKNLYKTARKFNAAIISISQSPEDFLSSKSSAAVIDNSYVKYFLRLQKGHEILSKLGLNELEIEDVCSLQSVRRKYSEIFLKFYNNCRVLKIQPSVSEYWICTTDAEDENIEKSIRAQNPQATELEILKKLIERGVK